MVKFGNQQHNKGADAAGNVTSHCKRTDLAGSSPETNLRYPSPTLKLSPRPWLVSSLLLPLGHGGPPATNRGQSHARTVTAVMRRPDALQQRNATFAKYLKSAQID